MTRLLLTTCAMIATLAAPALAQDSAVPASAGAPVEISADNGLVWDRSAHTYTAKGNAEVKQGDMKVTSDVLVARYNPATSSSDIVEVTADGNVILSSSAYSAFGDKAVYDITAGTAVLTGGNLRVTTAGETLTARDRLTYAAADGRMTAEGNAVLKRARDTLQAEKMTAAFSEVAGARSLDTVTASGGVTITTPREKVTGSRGVYRAATQQAELTGNVVITQGKNMLQGARAVVDMKTGVSKLFGGADTVSGGRVKGVFYPGAKTAQLNVPAAAPANNTAAPVMSDAAPTPTPTPEPLPAPVVTPAAKALPADSAVSDSTATVIEDKTEEQLPAGEPVSTGQKKAVEEDIAPQVSTPAQPSPAAQEDLPPEPFAIPAPAASTPTEPQGGAAAQEGAAQP